MISRQFLTSLLLLIMATSLTGCATVVSKKSYPVTMDNRHGPTYFSVRDRKNNVIQEGVTPQQVTLDAKSVPFWPAKYRVAFAGTSNHAENVEVKAGFDPWVAGNVLLGGGLGAAVDGFTGAMFKLPENVTGNVPAQYTVTDASEGTRIAAASLPTTATVEPEVQQVGFHLQVPLPGFKQRTEQPQATSP